MSDVEGAVYKRVLLKMSGQALMGNSSSAIDTETVTRIVHEIVQVHQLGVQIGIVVGGGNFFRGAALSELGINRITGDHMGMLATLMNALALRDSFEKSSLPVRILSAIPMSGVVDHFGCRKAIHHLKSGRVVIFAAGTGNPLVTTDSAASLRGVEVNADVVLKATNVDGVYDKDPSRYDDAKLFQRLDFKTALAKELKVMDLSAFCQCRDYGMPLRIFNINKPGALLRVIKGEQEGTTVSNGEEK
jgi:uridylate kinase